MALHRTSCCGCREFGGIEKFTSPEDVLKGLADDWFEWHGAFILFSYVVKNKIGRKFINYIKENGLGTITESEIRTSKATGERIRAFFWAVDEESFAEWFATNHIESSRPTYGWSIGDTVIAHNGAPYITTTNGWVGIVDYIYPDGIHFTTREGWRVDAQYFTRTEEQPT